MIISIFDSLYVQVRNQHRVDLLTGPERLGLENGWRWELANLTLSSIVRQPHEQLHSFVMINESVSLCHEHTSKKTVLDNTHHRLVALWIHNLTRYSHDLSDLS